MVDADRAQKGRETFRSVIGRDLPERAPSPFTDAARDFVFAEVWSRPGLDRRSRLWITLSCVAAAGAPTAIRTYLHAALDSGEVTMEELREFVLQFAVFQGFPKAAEIEQALHAVAAERG
ncbi:carboxymuconolactone decarboxylase family protein [Stakelama tenebrarum]|uniref:Carboxymuconolactone decarboxylase-like domain-containing protein n=1 Tax=Stakelama tenebrarum TaxID=2711215 RepID=A0A6G6Y2N3_9SPHN|nr:carboxymuconolactone decarboxylase family protein [Sphingosinithalassobacter tenebrarum]QIG79159.1 hypothetical protein G5C33_04725 [Sphingosinithalassobacter tenebrarum]